MATTTTSVSLSPPDFVSITDPKTNLFLRTQKPYSLSLPTTTRISSKRDTRFHFHNPLHRTRPKNTPIWRIHATTTTALAEAPPPPLEATPLDSSQQIVFSTTGDDNTSLIVSVLLFIGFIGLSILTIGVIYIGVTDFLQKREREKFEKEEEEAGKKKGGKKKKVRAARAGPRGFGQKSFFPCHCELVGGKEMEILSPASYISNSNWLMEEAKGARWTVAENKLCENALAVFDKDTPDRWHNVAAMIPGKSVCDVINKYEELEFDVSNIEAGLIPIPGYTTSTFKLDWVSGHGYDGFNKQSFVLGGKRSSTRSADQERKKGVPWTEEEHKLFLMGLKKYGKGDWRNISRNFVVTRTPTQVASHAQKYFIRQLSGGKDKRRASIHDITTVNLNDMRTPSPDNKRPTSPEQSAVVAQQPNSAAMSRTPFQWNQPSSGGGGANMGFHMTNGNMFVANPYAINTYGLKLQGHNNNNNLHRGAVHNAYFGPPSMVFQLQSTQHYPHG